MLPLRSCSPRLVGRHSLVLLLLVAATAGCREKPATSDTGTYTENGVTWAYGSVDIDNAGAGSSVMLSSAAGVQPLGTQASGAQASAMVTYTLTGVLSGGAGKGGIGASSELAYVDLHPSLPRLLAFSYQVAVESRVGTSGVVDVYAVLKKAGRSYFQRQKVWLGTSILRSGSQESPLTLAAGLKLARIARGVFPGALALHYGDLGELPFQGLCPASGAGGATLSAADCHLVPAADDLCNGVPTQDSCHPLPPAQTSGKNGASVEPAKITVDLTMLPAEPGVYTMANDTTVATIYFVALGQVAADDVTNAAECSKRFFAVARTVGQQANSSCILAAAPAAAQNGQLSCGLTVSFTQPESYMARICTVLGVFRGDNGDEIQHIQVLKK